MRRRALRLAGVVLAFVLPLQAAAAQDLDKLIVAAYSLRRRGKFIAATAAFEQLLPKVTDKTARRVISLEMAELFRVMGRPEKAITLYRRNDDVPREVETLLSMGTEKAAQDALTISRYVRYPRGEALALAKLGQNDAALKLMQEQGLELDRAELLVQLGRHDEAAKVYERLSAFYPQAVALEKAGRIKEARRAYEDAVTKLRMDLRDANGSLERVRKVKQLYDEAPDGVTRERTRLALAGAYGRLAGDYRKLAGAYAGAGRPDYAEKAPKLAQNALEFFERQLELLEDAAGGGDAFGAATAQQLGLPATIAEVRGELARYGSLQR